MSNPPPNRGSSGRPAMPTQLIMQSMIQVVRIPIPKDLNNVREIQLPVGYVLHSAHVEPGTSLITKENPLGGAIVTLISQRLVPVGMAVPQNLAQGDEFPGPVDNSEVPKAKPN